MRYYFTALMLLLSGAMAAQKKFTLHLGGGLGGVIEKRQEIPDCIPRKHIRLGAGAAVYYTLRPAFLVGVQVFAGDNLLPIGACNVYIPATNTEIMDNRSLPAAAYLIRSRYYFTKQRKIKFFADAGVGIVNYNALVTAEKGISIQSSFAFSPEIGFEEKGLNVSLLGIFGGRTPSYSGFDSFSNQNRTISTIHSQQLYLKIAYKIFIF
jgi:hypothetical protein